MTWYALRVDAGGRRQAIIEALLAGGAGAVQEDREVLVAHFEGEPVARAQADAVRRLAPGAACTVEAVPDTDWSMAWRRDHRPVTVGSITVAPPWATEGPADDRTVIIIDPGMAFGTGDHPSTRGALRLLQVVVPPPATVADCGAGSAVLAIAAARLGAARVFAIELDADALGNATANIARNGVGARVHLIEGDAQVMLPLVAPVDLVVANILSSVIVPMLPAMHRALPREGSAILSGLLVEERASLCAAFDAGGWRLVAEDTEDGWWSVRIARI